MDSSATALAKLDELLAAGIISEEDHTSRKAHILERDAKKEMPQANAGRIVAQPAGVRRPIPDAEGPLAKRPRGAMSYGAGPAAYGGAGAGFGGGISPAWAGGALGGKGGGWFGGAGAGAAGWGAGAWGGAGGAWGGAGGWGSWDPWSAGDDRVQCFVHGKMRGTQSCVMTGEGVWACRPDSTCKTADSGDVTETMICATHGSARAVTYLTQGPDGKWHCKVGRECKSKGGY